ncbi:MAG: hypothetical protein RL017_119 [Pseudomonadota bacterium]
MDNNNLSFPIGVVELMKYHMPHKFPFVLIDKIIEMELGVKVKAVKNVTINEPFFTGHFPDYPIMPGVLITEALAQAAGVLTSYSFGPRGANEIYVFAGLDRVRFKKQVVPGDVLILEATLIKKIKNVLKFEATATVDGVVAAEAIILIAKGDLPNV